MFLNTVHEIVWIQSRFKFLEKNIQDYHFMNLKTDWTLNQFNINIFRYQTPVTTPEVSL